MKENIIIIGGGVAGLSAALELMQIGLTPLVIEAGDYPSHKVCGEFLSQECLPFLQQWNIIPQHIKKARFQCGNQEFTLKLPTPAGSLSHWTLDPLLAKSVIAAGGKIYTNTKVKSIIPKANLQSNHRIELSTGEILTPSTLIIATGRIPGIEVPFTPKYVGIKTHFKGVDLHDTLEMFGFQGAYLGICPIEERKVNFACLALIDRFNWASPNDFIKSLLSENRRLRELLDSGEQLFDWMIAFIPALGFQETPNWLDTYFIGDAALTVPPACGDGLSLGIISGRSAAHYASRRDYIGFNRNYRDQHASLLKAAKGMHNLLMRPLPCKMALRTCSLFPSLGQFLFRMTRSDG